LNGSKGPKYINLLFHFCLSFHHQESEKMASIAASGIVLEPLTKDNYDNWSCLVRNYLAGHDLWGVVTSVSTIVVVSKEEVEAWNKDSMRIRKKKNINFEC